MLELILQYIIAPVTVALSGYIVYLLKENKKTTGANAKGTMLLLRRQIILAHTKFISKKEPMTAFDFEDLEEIHQAYKDLGGNGLTDKMWSEIEALDLGREEGSI